MTRYEVEAKVRDIVDEVADENDLEKDFFGDCYPDDVMHLENRIALERDSKERERMFKEIREIFMNYVQ